MEATEAAAILGRLGGPARAKKLSAEERKRIASIAGRAAAAAGVPSIAGKASAAARRKRALGKRKTFVA